MAKLPNFIQTAIRWVTGRGGLKSDTTPIDAQTGDLYVTGAETGGLNIRSVGKNTNLNNSYEPIYGNQFVYAGDAVTVQNKKFRLYVDISAVTSGTVSDFILALSSITGTSFVLSGDTITVTTIALALSDIDTSINTNFSAYTPTTTTTPTGTYTGYIDIEFTTAPTFNYVFSAVVDSNVMTLIVGVTQESVDVSMIGEWNMIGSDDEIGDCIQFWTTRRELPVEIVIFNITNPSGTIISVETISAHGLTDGMSVRISGVVGTVEANGEWIIANTTTTTFELLLAIYASTYVSSGTVTSSVYGLGEIGVAEEDNNGVISYTRLLRSNELNFSTLKQIDCRVKRKQDAKIATYFVDNNNQYRVFYYKGNYITDGAIATISTDGQYNYGSIRLDLQLFISNEGFGIRWFSQIQTGGNVKSGNWRYAVRFLTNELVPSEWSLLTDTVSVFSSNTAGPAYSLLGDEENILTPKQNTLEIHNSIPGIYTFCEIAAVNYIGSSMTGVVLGRYVLDGSEFQYITHTGNENNLIDLDLGELNVLIPSIATGRNVELLDNRLVISNLTPQVVLDLSEWVKTFMYSLEREGLDPIGVWNNAYNLLAVGEYQLPLNIYSKKSHMIYETYRYGFRFRLKGTGALTPVYYPGYDIKIDLPVTLPTERIAGSFTSFDLTNGVAGAPTEVYSIYINWLNVNMGFVIDGIPVHELISEIIPCRAELVPEVLASGVGILGVSGINTASVGIDRFWYGTTVGGPPVPVVRIGPFPYFMGYSNTNPTGIAIVNNPSYPVQTIGTPYEDPERDSVFFYSPDISFGLTSIVYKSGDQLISFGNGFRHDLYSDLPAFTVNEGDYSEYSGYSNITVNPTASIIDDALFATIGQELVTVDAKDHSLQYIHDIGIANVAYQVDQCVVIGLSANLANVGANTDYGFNQVLYYRPQTNKYGDPRTTIYTEFSVPYLIGTQIGFIPSGDILSYGDVFTQKTYLKFRNPGQFDRELGNQNDGFGMGVAYYSQNRHNIQLRRKPNPLYPAASIIPFYPLTPWLIFGTNVAAAPYILGRDAQFFYNKGYTPRNDITSAISFDSTANYQIDLGNFIMWSLGEVEGSNTDFCRIFPPLNIKVLDYTFGPITDARNINGDLVTVQHSRVERQYFNTTEVISTEVGSEVILGDGGVMRRKGQTLTKFGSQHKWSVLVGKSDKGFDVMYFIDVRNKTVCRYGYNGNDAIDEINGMKSFFANNLQWIVGKDTPAHDQGIHGVSNQRYRELMWTLRGRKDVGEWVRNDVSGNLMEGFDITYGDELIVNGNFASFAGWVALDDLYAPAGSWNHATSTLTGEGVAYHQPLIAGYLSQAVNIGFVVNSVYVIKIVTEVTLVTPVDISFQQAGAVIFTITTPGTYYFTYRAIALDDNIYIHQAVTGNCVVAEVSIKEVITVGNWSGGTTWMFGAAGALADGSNTFDLTQTVANYLVPGLIYELTYQIIYGTVGTITAYVADIADTPRSSSGTYLFSATPTVPGIVRFDPNGGFDGTVVNRFRIISNNPHDYSIGDVVSAPGTTTFEQTDDIYIAAADNSNSYPATNNPDWTLVPHTNPNYYTEYSIIFAELKEVFQSFFTPKPKIYAKFLNKYLVPRPVSDTSRVYVSDSGSPTTWFLDDSSVQTMTAFFEGIINQPPGRKRFLNVRVQSDIAPMRIDVQTDAGQSFTPNARFLERPDKEFDAYVMNTLTPAGLSDQDTSSMYGTWAKFRFTIQETTYNRINSFVAKVRSLARQYFK